MHNENLQRDLADRKYKKGLQAIDIVLLCELRLPHKRSSCMIRALWRT